ncbi:MAG: tandem-95 repeat protein, partial [Thermoplasmata archaeon]|nr:tandem-95 repeat protein [Thermoplasmata archaeon]
MPVEAPAFAGGDGSPGNPYNITDVDDLQNMSSDLSAHYRLINDIDATNTSVIGNPSNNGGLGYGPIGDNVIRFTGTFNGQNYTIINLFINRPGEDYIGLFGFIDSTAEIMNVIIENADITGNDNVGGLVGNNSGSIDNCHSDIVLSGHEVLGGLVGGSTPVSSITNSYAVGDIIGTRYIGGCIGMNYGTISTSYANVDAVGVEIGGFVGWNFNDINDCYATGSVDCGNVRAGGFADWNWAGTISNCYSTGQVTSFNDLGSGFNEINYDTVTNCFWDIETSGLAASTTGTGFNTAGMMNNFTFKNAGWDFTTTWFSVNESTRPFLRMEYDTTIRNSHQLQLMCMDIEADYTLTNDIDLDITNPASMWGTSIADGEGFFSIGTSADRFIGSLDGQGYNINNLYIKRLVSRVGLFSFVESGALINNVNLVNVNITGNDYTAGLVARLSGGSSTGNTFIINCSVEGVISGTNHVGGLVGYSYYGDIYDSFSMGNVVSAANHAGGAVSLLHVSLINNTHSLANVEGTTLVGGLIGEVVGSSVSNCSAIGTVNGNENVGGLVGANDGTVSNCTSNGTVIGSGDNVGGLIGYSDGPVANSTSFSKVSNLGGGHYYTGGLIGRQDFSPVSFCEAYGNVTGSTFMTGGLIGEKIFGTLMNSSAYGVTKGIGNYIGGLVGRNKGTIINSHAYGDTGTNNLHAWIGGLVGHNVNLGIIKNSSAHGDVFGSILIGGLVGENADTISNCSYNGAVTGTNNIGGLVGKNSGGTISNCSSKGTVIGNGDNVGGLVGFSDGPVTYSKSFSEVSNLGAGKYYTGGLIGQQQDSTVSFCEAHGNVTGSNFMSGGLIGQVNALATVTDCSSYGLTKGTGNYIGGVVGRNMGTIITSHAYGDTGEADAHSWVGGLVGDNGGSGIIQNSSAQGDVFGTSITGGFVGRNTGLIERSFSNGTVMSNSYWVGGFAGQNGHMTGDGVIIDSYSQSDVTANDKVGGFAGAQNGSSTLTNVYSTGMVTGNTYVGGLVGFNDTSTVTDSHWDIETSGHGTSDGGTGNTDMEMMSHSTFTNWNFTDVWGIHEANTYPFLLPFGVPPEPAADLEISLVDLQDPASTNGTLTYMLTLTNHGPDNAADLYVNITLPTEVSFLNSNPPLNVNGRYLDADIGSLLNGESGGAFINVTVNSFGSGELNCTAFVTSPTQDPGAFINETNELTQLHLAPVAVDDAETLDEDSGASTIYVLENDTDAEDDDITIIDVTQPNNGTVVITEAGKNLTYEPDADWNGINTFTYTIIDDVGGRDMATVTVTVLAVDDASIAVNDIYNVTEDSGATTFDVLANDYDTDGDAITISTATSPAHGSIVIAADGLSIDYTPDADFFGTDSFTYNVSSGISQATVTIDVTPVNDVPVITTTDIITATEAVLYSVDYNATDVDLDTLTWSLTTNASWLNIRAGDGLLSGTPSSAGTYWLNVTVDDGNDGIDWSNFSLTVAAGPNTAPVISTTTAPDGVEGQLYGFQVNATDADGDDLTWALDSNATWLSLNGTGYLSGTPTADGTHWVLVTVDDGNGGSDSVNLTIMILPDMDGDGTPDATDTDCDGDGVPNSEDDFPNDPAASVDTDDDGKPDDWNEGYTADDSTTGLVLDDDDDNDGILDIDDDNPLVPDDTGGSNTWLYVTLILVIVGA